MNDDDNILISLVSLFCILFCLGSLLNLICNMVNRNNGDENRILNENNNNIVVDDDVPPKYEDIIN